jgi:hypothetical protein
MKTALMLATRSLVRAVSFKFKEKTLDPVLYPETMPAIRVRAILPSYGNDVEPREDLRIRGI